MAKRAWHYIGRSSSDGTPGLAQTWETYIARSRDGLFYIMLSGDEVQTESFGSADALAGFITDLGTPTPGVFASALSNIRGFKGLVDKLREAEHQRACAARQREIEALGYVLDATKPARNSTEYVDWWQKVSPLLERLAHLQEQGGR